MSQNFFVDLVSLIKSMSCTCISCSTCHGKGTIHVDDKTQPTGWDLETCPECRGSGVEERCADCELAIDDDW